MIITIKDIENSLKSILDKSSVQSIESVYEKSNDGYKLVIDIKNFYSDKTNIVYTKLIFDTDKEKIYLMPNDNKEYKFRYLHELNCNYKIHIFENIKEFEKLFLNIIEKNIFGEDIKILSQFIKSPSSLINNWFSNNDIKNISVYDIKFDEKFKIMPCKSLFFNFIINLNNQMNINLTIQKEDLNNYIFTFKIYNNIIKKELPNLTTMIQVIGDSLKTEYI